MDRPNVISISWHDTGRFFGCYGVPTVQSPAIDRLAAEGVLFENCFAAGSVCSPSRGALLTGQYPQRNGLRGLCHGTFPYQLRNPHDHLSHRLRAHGWHTVLAGFQHEVRHDEVHRLGFHERIATRPVGPWHLAPGQDVADGAIAFLGSERARQPFYLQLGLFETHRAYNHFNNVEPDSSRGVTVPPVLVDNDAARDDMAWLQGAVRTADRETGRVLAELERQGLAENTIIVFSIDHGLSLPLCKGTMRDGGLGIAFLLRWPRGGVAGGRRSERLISNVDFVPTLFELLGLGPAPDFDGVSFADELGDWVGAEPRPWVHAMRDDAQRCVRSDRHKLIYNYEPLADFVAPVDFGRLTPSTRMATHPDLVPVAPVELYDLREDPAETRNLAAHPDYTYAYENLAAEMRRWMERTGDPLLGRPVPARPQGRSAVS